MQCQAMGEPARSNLRFDFLGLLSDLDLALGFKILYSGTGLNIEGARENKA